MTWAGESALGGKLREKPFFWEKDGRGESRSGRKTETEKGREAFGENSRDAQLSFQKPPAKVGGFLIGSALI